MPRRSTSEASPEMGASPAAEAPAEPVANPDAETERPTPAPAREGRPFGFADFTIYGRVARDPELRFSETGNPRTRFTLATNDFHGQPSWHDLVAFGKLAEIVAHYGRKGQPIVVRGRLATHSYLDGEARRKQVDLICDRVDLVSRPPAANPDGEGETDS